VTRGYRGDASLPPGPARDLVDLLRRLRQYRGLSVGQIAVRAGLSRSHVSEVLRGWKTPSPDVAVSIARALGGNEGETSNAHRWAGQARDVRYYQRAAGVTGPARPAEAGHQRVTPRELPSAVAGFTGRSAELDALTGLLDRPGQRAPGVVVSSAISGTAGVGKTALAVHWAHMVVDRFPDGQLYVNLRGYDPGQPVSASDALAGLLRSLGVPGQDIPPEEDERAARFRSLLAGKRMLVVLDDARDSAQVAPLLPGTPGCMVIITSRWQLTELATGDCAHLLTVDPLSAAEARQMLAQRIGEARVAAEPTAVAELIDLCARLPMALAIAATRAAAVPGLPLADLVAGLRDLASWPDSPATRDRRTEPLPQPAWDPSI